MEIKIIIIILIQLFKVRCSHLLAKVKFKMFKIINFSKVLNLKIYCNSLIHLRINLSFSIQYKLFLLKDNNNKINNNNKIVRSNFKILNNYNLTIRIAKNKVISYNNNNLLMII